MADESQDRHNPAEAPDETPREEAPEEGAAAQSFLSGLLQLARRHPRRAATAGTAAILLCLAVVWLATRGDGAPPPERLRTALELLDSREGPTARQQAQAIARSLQQIDYRNPEFAGAAEFILGIAAFRDARGREEVSRNQHYLRAVRYLKEAEKQAMPDERRPEWAYALGTSLHELGSTAEAGPLLEEALESFPRDKWAIQSRLIDGYLNQKSPEALAKALELSDAQTSVDDFAPIERDRAYLRRAQVYLALGRTDDASRALEQVSEKTPENNGTVVLRARTLMADGKHRQAIRLLRPIAEDIGLERTFARQASFLIGVCHEAIGDVDNAIRAHRETARNYEDEHEGRAALLRAADLLRNKERDEEALLEYRRALELVGKPENFHNPWLTLEEFRGAIRDAWNGWVNRHAYSEAIALSKVMTPLLSNVEARRFTALANQRWAEHLEDELRKATVYKRKERKRELLMRWRDSGRAYAALAEALKTSSEYPDALWTSAEHLRNGHDFDAALRQLTRFIKTQPKTRLPLAVVRRGEVLMDLDRLEEAIEHFRRVIETFPTDPAAFEAQFVIGQCYLERDDLEMAEATWLDILTSEELTPAAEEWRLALFSLGRLQYHFASMLMSRARRTEIDEPDDEEAKRQLSEAFDRWQKSIRRLDEFLKRYPRSAQANEGRYLLAKALQRSAEMPRRKLEEAETENARMELRRTMHARLEQANAEFRQLRDALQVLDSRAQLDDLGRRMLRECYFQNAHTFYELGRYRDAIAAYSSAANKYPQDPQVLLAYMQMTNCYDALGRDNEARSMLLQAKVILKGMPDDVFQANLTNLDRSMWESWLQWARQIHQTDAAEPTAF